MGACLWAAINFPTEIRYIRLNLRKFGPLRTLSVAAKITIRRIAVARNSLKKQDTTGTKGLDFIPKKYFKVGKLANLESYKGAEGPRSS